MPHVRNDKVYHTYGFNLQTPHHEIFQRLKEGKDETNSTVLRRLLDWIDRDGANPTLETMLAIDYVQAAAFNRWDHIPDYLMPSEKDKERLIIAIQGVIATQKVLSRQLLLAQQVEEGQQSQ